MLSTELNAKDKKMYKNHTISLARPSLSTDTGYTDSRQNEALQCTYSELRKKVNDWAQIGDLVTIK